MPSDIRAEIVCNYLGQIKQEITFHGSHKRNAYEDILSVTEEEDKLKVELSRAGLYDILPEALFHPIDRFDNLPVNEYKERFAEEVEQQRIEESNARSFFLLYDKFIFGLSSIVAQMKQSEYGDNRKLSDIICDSLSDKYGSNRFVSLAKGFLPRCHSMRGNMTLITLMLRKILSEEGLRLVRSDNISTFEDNTPRYNCRIQDEDIPGESYLGNIFEEKVIVYDVHYWNDDLCDATFLQLVNEIKVFEDFINDYFMGVETPLRFRMTAHTLPVRLSDGMCCNYLNYNTNL